MKTKYIAVFLFFVTALEQAKTQNWLWSRQIGGTSNDGTGYSIQRICFDQNNNVYFFGGYNSNPCYFETDSLQPSIAPDFFVAKYDGSGNEIWAKNFNGLGTSSSKSISTMCYNQNTNHIYISGSFDGQWHIGNDTLLIGMGGQRDAFIACLDTSGSILWAKQAGGNGNNYCTMDADSFGNVYAQFMIAGPGTIDVINAPSAGTYFAKFDSNGNIKWAIKKFSYGSAFPYNEYDAYYRNIRIKGGKIFGIGATFMDTLTADTVTIVVNGLPVISCFDTNGTAVWIRACAGYSSFMGGGGNIVIDANKNSYITGNFENTAIFGNDTLYNANGWIDMYFAKYDSSGKAIWAKQINSTTDAMGVGIAMGNDTSIYVTGYFANSATFGSINVNSIAGDMFLARFDSSGNCSRVKQATALGMGVGVDGNGDVYATGVFDTVVQFDSNPQLISYGQNDIYLAKISALSGVGSNKITNTNQLVIYANPNQGTCTVIIPDEFLNNKRLSLDIYDNSGKIIQTVPVDISDKKVRISLEQEAKGVYPVTLSNGHKTYSGKIVFE